MPELGRITFLYFDRPFLLLDERSELVELLILGGLVAVAPLFHVQPFHILFVVPAVLPHLLLSLCRLEGPVPAHEVSVAHFRELTGRPGDLGLPVELPLRSLLLVERVPAGGLGEHLVQLLLVVTPASLPIHLLSLPLLLPRVHPPLPLAQHFTPAAADVLLTHRRPAHGLEGWSCAGHARTASNAVVELGCEGPIVPEANEIREKLTGIVGRKLFKRKKHKLGTGENTGRVRRSN
mmetsp:Transcript_8231/g.21225  ORF Transcript_8231/g.21225 Transcript_8231/m.21225 type:complete len:236 (-) Transcript_8231:270-977(-)